jgi:predicted lipid-binding transport protein (Tim44 family)
VERESLRRWIVREAPIPIGRAASAAASVAEAVARRHAEGRPAGDAIDAETIEISWDAEGEPSVFLASALFDIAPGDPDPAEDIPRIGAVLYELLAGAPPPARRAPPPVQRDRPDVPEALGELVLACFRPGAPGCPGSAAEVAVRLGQFEGLHVRTRPIATVSETAPEPASRPTPVLPTPVRPLEDRTLAHPQEGVEEIAVAEGGQEAPRARGKLAAGILALTVAAGVLALVVVSTVRNRARPAPSSSAAAVSPAPTAAPPTTAPPPAATSLPASPAAVAAPAVTAVVLATPATPAAELSAQRGSPPEVTPEAAPAATNAKDAERLREALDAWVESMNGHDLSGHMRLYMPRVATFYRARNVSRDFVWSEKSRQFANLVEVRATRPDVVFGPDGQTATLTFRKRAVTTDRSGETRQELDWVKTPKGWRIVGER